MNELEIINLTKRFKLSKKQQKTNKTNDPYLTALKDFSLTLQEGEIFGILGPNGASSLIKPDEGLVKLNGEDIYKDVYSYRKRVGFLTSELKLDGFFTPDYTFTYMSRLYGIDEETIKDNKEKLFNRFGINRFKDVKIADLSTGMKQKVSLAISLCNDPEIIIFDEPTNGLDIVATKDVEDYLISLKGENKIILISTHIFSIIEKLCDKVAVILHGEKVLEGDLKDLTKEKSLSDIFFELYTEEE